MVDKPFLQYQKARKAERLCACSDAGKEYLKLFDAEHGTTYLDDGEGTVVGSGRLVYNGLVQFPVPSVRVFLSGKF